MRKFSLSILEQLKKSHPIPVPINLYCYNKETIKYSATVQAWGYVRKHELEANMHLAVKQGLPRIVNTVAHEYYHCIQKYVLKVPCDHPELEQQAIKFAAEFTLSYLKEYNRNKNETLTFRKIL